MIPFLGGENIFGEILGEKNKRKQKDKRITWSGDLLKGSRILLRHTDTGKSANS